MSVERAVRTEHDASEHERQRFVDAIGAFFTRYGAAATVGRVFALLLTSDEPLSLDDIAARLGISKSGCSVAARDLERLGLIHRHVTRGTRRILYEAHDDMLSLFDAQFARIRQQRSLFAQGESLVHSARAKERLRRMLDLHDFWLEEIAGIVERWRQR
ncbi:MAG TPA: MarR family transcriptional regulator [Chloroflexota bacterium]|nr:MarR family transcriptional regulator [Chloroflexota bacterium]